MVVGLSARDPGRLRHLGVHRRRRGQGGRGDRPHLRARSPARCRYGAFLGLTPLLTALRTGAEGHPGWVRWPGLALMLFALIESYSRVGWVLFVLGVVILAWPRAEAARGRVRWSGLASLLMVVSADVRDAGAAAGLRRAHGRDQRPAGYESYGWRIANWNGLLDKWSEKPLLGCGLKSHRVREPARPRGGRRGARRGIRGPQHARAVPGRGRRGAAGRLPGLLRGGAQPACGAFPRTAWASSEGARVLLVDLGPDPVHRAPRRTTRSA